MAQNKLREQNLNQNPVEILQFDDLETIEHTKCKPLSVILAVERNSRRVLGFEVSRMPAKGLLAAISRKKYGPRADERPRGRRQLLGSIGKLLSTNPVIMSDDSPHYPNDVKRFFPQAQHIVKKGGRGAITGQGELKKLGFDPLFSINHTFAKCRADVNRLFRKTWCTTKKPECLKLHLAIMIVIHNHRLKDKKMKIPIFPEFTAAHVWNPLKLTTT